MTDEVRAWFVEEISKILCLNCIDYYCTNNADCVGIHNSANQILSITDGEHELSITKIKGVLPSLPCVECDKYINNNCTDDDPECTCSVDDTYQEAQQDMIKANWKQVI